MRRLPTSSNDGYGKTIQPLSALFDQSSLPVEARTPRPAVVWFLSSEPDVKTAKKMFDDTDVAIAARYFDCVKIYVEDIESPAERARYAKVVPTIIFMDAGAKETGRLTGTSAPGDILRQMNKAANVHFKKSLTDHVAKYGEFLKRFDKLDGKLQDVQQELKDHEEHVIKHPCDRAKNGIKECNEEIGTMRVDRDKLLVEEKALLKVELKADPFAKPVEKKPAD